MKLTGVKPRQAIGLLKPIRMESGTTGSWPPGAATHPRIGVDIGFREADADPLHFVGKLPTFSGDGESLLQDINILHFPNGRILRLYGASVLRRMASDVLVHVFFVNSSSRPLPCSAAMPEDGICRGCVYFLN